MSLTFASRIDGTRIRCVIGTDRALTAPVLCFSLMAAPKVISGGTMVRPVADQFYGDRTYRASDPEGHIWTFGVTVMDLSSADWDKASGGPLRTQTRL